MHRHRSLPIIAASAIALILTGCASEEASDTADYAAPAPPTVSVLTVQPEAVTVWDELPGRVSPFRSAEIRSQVSGMILQRLFDEGAEVTAGQPLFQIETSSFEADVTSAEAGVKKAEAALLRAITERDRAQTLLDGQNISQQNFDQVASELAQAEADVAQAGANLRKAQITLELATVRAPFDGKIGAALVSEGALTDAAGSTVLAKIQQVDKVFVDVRQPASMLELLKSQALNHQMQNAQGIPVQIFVGAEESPISAQALFSDLSVDEGTGNVRMRVVADNPDMRLLPGMFVRALVPRGTYPEAIMVPQQAIVRDISGATSLYVVRPENEAMPVPVQVGELVDGEYVIRDGIEPGMTVIVLGQDKLYGPGPVEPSALQDNAPPVTETAAP